MPGGQLFLVAVQDIRAGGRQSNAAISIYAAGRQRRRPLFKWTPKLVDALEHSSVLADVNSDQQQKGLETDLVIDRDTASRLGITPAQIDNTLYDAFGQRQVSVIYSAINQYHVVMEIDPRYTQYPASLQRYLCGDVRRRRVGNAAIERAGGHRDQPPATAAAGNDNVKRNRRGQRQQQFGAQCRHQCARQFRQGQPHPRAPRCQHSGETMVPLAAFSHYKPGNTPLVRQPPGPVCRLHYFVQSAAGRVARRRGGRNRRRHQAQIRMPASIHGSLAGTAQVFQQSLDNEPVLIAAAIAAVYILLGVLYESYIHPITILSTLPSAGVGALLALMLFHTEFSIIGLIGVILLIGIVKKNAIMMIDFAIEAKRARELEFRTMRSFRPACCAFGRS